MTGERQFATDLDRGEGTACSSGRASVKIAFSAASCRDKKNFCCWVESYEQLVPFLC